MGETSIEWTRNEDGTAGKVWNPVTGCTKVSEGCRHCYAERVFPRAYGNQNVPATRSNCVVERDRIRPRKFTDVLCHPERLEQPLHWRKPQRIFVNSMSDLFHEVVPDEFIDRVFAVMALCPQHIFQVLTKRPERMWKYLTYWPEGSGRVHWVAGAGFEFLKPKFKTSGWSSSDPEWKRAHEAICVEKWPLKNVHLGVSVENQATFEDRWNWLGKTPAASRFISFEPLLDSIDTQSEFWEDLGEFIWPDWIIIGGESGPGARPCDLAWIRSLVQQCKAVGVPCFVKQLGRNAYDSNIFDFSVPGYGMSVQDSRFYLLTKDRKGGDPDEWPEDLRVREFPVTVSGRAISAAAAEQEPRRGEEEV